MRAVRDLLFIQSSSAARDYIQAAVPSGAAQEVRYRAPGQRARRRGSEILMIFKPLSLAGTVNSYGGGHGRHGTTFK